MKLVAIMPKNVGAEAKFQEGTPSDWELVFAHSLDDLTDKDLEGADVVMVTDNHPLNRKSLERLRHVKLVQQFGVGVDSIDTRAAEDMGIPVANAPTGNTVSVVEYVIMAAILLTRRVPEAENLARAGETLASVLVKGTFEIEGRTLGIVGFGNIGKEVARRTRPLGMKVLYYDVQPADEKVEKELGVRRVSLDELLAESDVVTLHVPLTRATRNLIGKAELLKMKKGAVLINAARGGVVNEGELAEVLEQNHLAGAAVDVCTTEPIPPFHPLLAAPNVLLTPHMAGSTMDGIMKQFKECFMNATRVANGEEPVNRVC